MKPDLLRYKTEFTLDEVARLWAGVEAETPENRETVISALRILLRAIEKLRLFANGPDSIADVPLRTAAGDYNYDSPWRSVFVTRQALEDWFARERQPPPKWLALEALEEEIAQEEGQLVPSSLAPEAGPSVPPSNKKSGYSQEALLRIIGGLVVLKIKKSGSKYLKGERINLKVLHEEIIKELERVEASMRGVSQSQFYEIFKEILTEDFYVELGKALHPEE